MACESDRVKSDKVTPRQPKAKFQHDFQILRAAILVSLDNVIVLQRYFHTLGAYYWCFEIITPMISGNCGIKKHSFMIEFYYMKSIERG